MDYLHTDKKQLQHMYGDEPATRAANPEPATVIAPPVTVPVETVTATAADAPIETDFPPSMEKPVNKKSRRKALNLELYSRAKLEEKFIAPDITKALTVTPVKKADAPTVKAPERSFVSTSKKPVEDTDIVFKRVNLSSFSRAPLRRRAVVADTTAVPATAASSSKN